MPFSRPWNRHQQALKSLLHCFLIVFFIACSLLVHRFFMFFHAFPCFFIACHCFPLHLSSLHWMFCFCLLQDTSKGKNRNWKHKSNQTAPNYIYNEIEQTVSTHLVAQGTCYLWVSTPRFAHGTCYVSTVVFHVRHYALKMSPAIYAPTLSLPSIRLRVYLL